MTEKCCGRTLGHGLSCTPDYLCDQCQLIKELYEELQLAETFATEVCISRLEGYDRDGLDLWWSVPYLFAQEAGYLLKKRILVKRKDGKVAWKYALEEEHA